jgi:hypothetical protein
MKCVSFQDRIDRFLAGTLGAGEQAQALDHLAHCADCRRIVEIFGPADAPGPQDPALTEAILAQTSQAACQQLQSSLGDLCDGRLDPVAQQLAERHLAGCARCARLHRVVQELALILEDMAQVALDEELTARILAATSGRIRWWERAMRAQRRRWQQWLARPRFGLEFAYVATVVVALLTATPVSPLRQVPVELKGWLQGATADSTQAGPLSAGPDLLLRLPGRVVDLGSTATYGVRVDLTERKQQTSRVWTRMADHGGELLQAAADRDLARMGAVLSQVGCDVKLMWKGVRKQLPETDPLECGPEEASPSGGMLERGGR